MNRLPDARTWTGAIQSIIAELVTLLSKRIPVLTAVTRINFQTVEKLKSVSDPMPVNSCRMLALIRGAGAQFMVMK